MGSTSGKSYDFGRSRTSAPNDRRFDRNLSNSPQRAALSAVLLALLLLAPQAAWAQVATLQSTTDGSTYYQWNILGDGSTNNSNGVTSSPTFDYGLRLYVNNTVFPTQSSATTSSVSAGGTMATLGPVTMSGLSVSRSVYAPRSSTYPWLRWTDTYTNSTSASITVPVEVRTDLWHDSNTTYSKNNLTSTSGSYIVAAPTSYQPAVLLYFRGSSGQTFSETPTISASHGTQDLITVKWNVTVPAGGTVRMVYFAAMASSATIASSIQEKLLYGFSSAHYNFSTTGSTSYSESLSNSCGRGYKSSTAVAYSSTYFAPYTFSEIGTIKTYRTTDLYSSTINLVDAAYNSYMIYPNGTIDSYSSCDNYDTGMELYVNGTKFNPTTWRTPTPLEYNYAVRTATMRISGLDVTRQIYVPQNSYRFARFLDIFYNPTSSPITVPIRVYSNLGSDSSTVVHATSSGDTTVNANDFWFVTDDSTDSGDDAALLHYVYWDKGLKPSSTTLQSSGYIEVIYQRG